MKLILVDCCYKSKIIDKKEHFIIDLKKYN